MATKKKTATKKAKMFSITKKITLSVCKEIAAENWDDALSKGRDLEAKEFIDFKQDVDLIEYEAVTLEGIYELG